MILWTKNTCPDCDGHGITGYSWGTPDTCRTCDGLGGWQTLEEYRVNETEEQEISTGALKP